MATLRPEVKRKWTEALRSGKYTQGRESLRTASDKFCCLGVLCEIAAAEDVIPVAYDEVWGDYRYGDQGIGDDRTGALPVAVQEWAYEDFDDSEDSTKLLADPKLGDWHASDWNDSRGASFTQIADLIEKYL